VYAGTHTDGPALYINKENKCDKWTDARFEVLTAI
jgi:hypothetical protein